MTRRTDKSAAALDRASKVLVGGVNSPVRAYAAVGGTPPFIARAKGSSITDVDGNSYVDYVCSYGPAILGHAPESVVTAVNKAARHGMTFGAPTEAEVRLGEAITAAVPSAEKVRFVSSGTEAVMTAIRLARAATGRTKIIKCVGCYHGHADAMLVQAGSGAAALGVPSSPGVPPGAAGDTIAVAYNDPSAVAEAMGGGDAAAMLVEPVAANMGVVPPAEGYLTALRELCDEHGALLIFDEVITGFRLSLGGAQKVFGVLPDLTTLGKIVGGGLPVGVVAGPAVLMDHLAPVGDVYQAGTLSGNPLAMAAGLATIEALQQEGFYEALERISDRLARGLDGAAQEAGLGGKVTVQQCGSMVSCFFAPPPIARYANVSSSDTAAFAAFFHEMLRGGVHLAPSAFEAMFVSGAHDEADVDTTIAAAGPAFAKAGKLMRGGESGR